MTGSSGTDHRGPSAPTVEPRSPARENWVRSEEDEFYWQGDSTDVRHDPPESMARQSYALRAMRQKDHVSAGLFAVFMGLFGMHKFYLGYYKTGFIMLAVSIIGGICSFGLAAAVKFHHFQLTAGWEDGFGGTLVDARTPIQRNFRTFTVGLTYSL